MPSQGIGQGNGTEYQVLVITSSVILQTLYNKELATETVTPKSKKILELYDFIFVDNSDIITNSGCANNPQLTIEKMQTTFE